MEMVKRTYSLPLTIAKAFEKEVESGNRSAMIVELIQNWLERQHRERLRQAIIEGCREMSDVYLEIEGEYHPLEEEVHRALDN
jgi:Arc/MetJ-type ribon-helix-helix transcriptional regulator